ncbi:MAG: FAD-dependent oxidoreductase [Spirochaetaceae bacterium]|nr:FAD-dependent oxidoreductase [Spirochaetaceae bacterium]
MCAGSTGEGDAAIQAYNVRLCLTNDPQKRRLPAKPAWYRRELFHKLRGRWTVSGGVPVRKVSWNAANLPEGGWRYPLASGEERRRITERHRDWALGLLHFLQNDADVPDELARRILNCVPGGRGVTRGEWNELLRVRGMPPERHGPESATPLTRAEAAGLAYRLLAR